MRFLAISFIIAVSCAITANGFFFKKKFVDGCNPDPCKHKAVCKLDYRDTKLFTCECPKGYHGKLCDLSTGCRKNPCGKHGVCTDTKGDLSKYTCKCEKGYVGKDCDTVDKCLKKNPCKSGSVCTLDKKLKPVCGCKPGFTGKKCDKRDCPIIKFKGKNFGKGNVFIDKEIKSKFEKMDNLAKLCGVQVDVKRSFTKLVNPTDMIVNNEATFFIGRGIEFTLNDKKGKLICDKKCLGKLPIANKQAQCFINGLDAIYWKYSSYLPGVIHDGTHVANFKSFNDLKVATQTGCQQDKHFPVVTGRDHLVVDYNPNSSKKCPKGLAGPKCDKDDLCVKKNPCNKDSVCSLDAKLKPVCACPNGYTGKKCNKKNCTITKWKGKNFGGSFLRRTKLYISDDMTKNFKKLDDLAKKCNVQFKVLNSFSKNTDPKYKVDEKSPLYVGYGIDVILNDKKGKLLCNKVCLAKNPSPMPAAKCLLDGLSGINFKHNPKYPGIIYEASLLKLTVSAYTKLKELKQVGCSGESFYKKL